MATPGALDPALMEELDRRLRSKRRGYSHTDSASGGKSDLWREQEDRLNRVREMVEPIIAMGGQKESERLADLAWAGTPAGARTPSPPSTPDPMNPLLTAAQFLPGAGIADVGLRELQGEDVPLSDYALAGLDLTGPMGKALGAGLGGALGATRVGRMLPSERDLTTGAEAGRPTPVEGASFSSRVPTTKSMEGAAQAAEAEGSPLTIDWEEWKRTPKAAEAAARVRASPYTRIRSRGTLGILDEAAEEQARNLVYLHEQVDPAIRPRSENWYLGANRATADRAERYGLPHENVAGVYAALSPQKDWFQNLELGDRLLDIWSQRENLEWTPEMLETALSGRVGMNSPAAQQAFRNIQGQPLAALDAAPEIGLWSRIWDQTYNTPHYRVVDPEGYKGDWALAKSGAPMNIQWGSLGETSRAVDALRAQDLATVSRALGGQHKVRSFGTNISNPMDPRYSTADTHAVAAGALRPLGGAAPEVLQNFGQGMKLTDPSFEPWMASVGREGATGYQGTYPITQRGIELAGQHTGTIPRGEQSITWEAARNLFENQKSAPMQQAANAVWRAYGSGRITQREAQEAIMNLFGPAVPPPAWAR